MVRYFILDITDLKINGCNEQKFNNQRFQRLKKFKQFPALPLPGP